MLSREIIWFLISFLNYKYRNEPSRHYGSTDKIYTCYLENKKYKSIHHVSKDSEQFPNSLFLASTK